MLFSSRCRWYRLRTSVLGVAVVAMFSVAGCGRRAAETAVPGVPSGLVDTTAVLDIAAVPQPLRAGGEITWTLHLRDRASGRVLTNFDVVHDKQLHLVVVARDLTWFNHIHPTLAADGTWTTRFTVPRAGTYRFFADYTRTGPQHEVIVRDVTTSEPQAGDMTAAALVADAPDAQGFIARAVEAAPEGHPDIPGGAAYTVKLMPMPAYIIAGQPVMLHAMVLDAHAQPVRDLEPYLGAAGHAVVISEDGARYLHVHPMGDSTAGMSHEMPGMPAGDASMTSDPHGPNVMFHTQFPRGGRYRVWLQFQHRGAIITAPFVLDVRDAS